MSPAISGILNAVVPQNNATVPHNKFLSTLEKHGPRLLGQSCVPNTPTGLQFCTVLNGVQMTSNGVALATSLDIELGYEFQYATSLGFKMGNSQWNLPDNSVCRSAFAAYACLDGVGAFHCIGGVQAKSGPCPSTCRAFTSACSSFTSATIESVCGAATKIDSCTTGTAVNQSSSATATSKKSGDKCTAQVIKNMASCTALNGLELTQDGVTVAAGLDLAMPDVIKSFTDAVPATTPACAAAYSTLMCLQKLAPFSCVAGAQAVVAPCSSVCTNYMATCSPGLSASQASAICTMMASALPASATCNSAPAAAPAAALSTSRAAARAHWPLAAAAIAAAACAVAPHAAAEAA
jgi:hypothetical protein